MFKNFIKISLIASLLATSIISCKKKDPTPDDDNSTSTTSTSSPTLKIDLSNPEVTKIIKPSFSPLDANSVTKELKISNSTLKKGSPAAPTGEFDAPYVYSDLTAIRTKLGDDINLIIDGDELKNVAGVYLKVQGSDDYFDIKATSSGAKQRKKTHHRGLSTNEETIISENVSVNIEIPSNVTEGEFCISYCVYTADGQISNVISRCIEVQEFGGNITFSGDWKLIDMNIKIDTLEQIYVKTGEWFSFDFGNDFDDVPCIDDFRVKLENMTLAFGQSGAFIAKGNSEYQSYDIITTYNQNTDKYEHTCGELTTEIDDSDNSGAWNYNKTTQVLTMLYNDGISGSSFEEYKVFHEGNNLTFLYDEDGVKATLNLQK